MWHGNNWNMCSLHFFCEYSSCRVQNELDLFVLFFVLVFFGHEGMKQLFRTFLAQKQLNPSDVSGVYMMFLTSMWNPKLRFKSNVTSRLVTSGLIQSSEDHWTAFFFEFYAKSEFLSCLCSLRKLVLMCLLPGSRQLVMELTAVASFGSAGTDNCVSSV